MQNYRFLSITIKTFLIICFLSSCSTEPSHLKFDSSIQEKHCEEALTQVPEQQNGYKFVSSIQQASGTIFYYTGVGTSYATEVLWDGVLGTTVVVLVCAPTVALSTVAHAGSSFGVPCFAPPGEMFNAVSLPPIGRKTKESLKNLKCPNVDGLSQSIRKVAACYRDLGDQTSLNKALSTLNSISDSEDFYKCQSPGENENFKKDLNPTARISRVNPSFSKSKI